MDPKKNKMSVKAFNGSAFWGVCINLLFVRFVYSHPPSLIWVFSIYTGTVVVEHHPSMRTKAQWHLWLCDSLCVGVWVYVCMYVCVSFFFFFKETKRLSYVHSLHINIHLNHFIFLWLLLATLPYPFMSTSTLLFEVIINMTTVRHGCACPHGVLLFSINEYMYTSPKTDTLCLLFFLECIVSYYFTRHCVPANLK